VPLGLLEASFIEFEQNVRVAIAVVDEGTGVFAEAAAVLCRLGALKSTFPATMQGEPRESGGGAGRPVRAARTPNPARPACPHAPCPEIAKIDPRLPGPHAPLPV
jgi:hypothetical protein